MATEEYSAPMARGQQLRSRRWPARLAPAFGLRTGMVLALAGVTWACTPPDRPGRLAAPLPGSVASDSGLHLNRALSLAPGLAYFDIRVEEGPWAIHLLRADMGRCELGLETLPAPHQEGMAGGRSKVTELFATAASGAVAAVNGDFFLPEEGITSGAEVVGGKVRTVSARPALAWRPGEDPWVGIPATEGDSVLVTAWRIPRGQADGVTQVVGGFPMLLRGGEPVGDLEVSDRPEFAAARHPRTALGFDPSTDVLWILVVDGRQPDYSAGMTLPELTGFLESLGATEALNLDGGGSSVMVLRGFAVSRPSDAEGERPVANALGVRFDPGLCLTGR